MSPGMLPNYRHYRNFFTMANTGKNCITIAREFGAANSRLTLALGPWRDMTSEIKAHSSNYQLPLENSRLN